MVFRCRVDALIGPFGERALHYGMTETFEKGLNFSGEKEENR